MFEPSETWLTALLAWVAAIATRRMFSVTRSVNREIGRMTWP